MSVLYSHFGYAGLSIRKFSIRDSMKALLKMQYKFDMMNEAVV